MAKKAYSTQSLVNTYPLWSKVRTDEQSLGYQILNSIGQQIDDLQKQSSHIYDNFFLGTSIIRDIDVYYKLQLSGDFEFTKEDNDETELLFTPPTTSGTLTDGTVVNIQIADKNNIETFWYTPAPDRISSGEILLDAEYLLASGFVFESPLLSLVNSGIIDHPNRLFVTIQSGTQFYYLDDDQVPQKTIVQLQGTTRSGRNVTEELFFIQNETLPTQYEYQIFSGVTIFGVTDREEAFVKVKAAQFNEEEYPFTYQLVSTENKEEMPLFWCIDSNEDAEIGKLLGIKKWELDDIVLRATSSDLGEKFTLQQVELLATSGTRITPLDLAVEPRSDNLWIVDSGMLYLYDTDLPYTDNSALLGKEYDSACIIEPSTYYAVIGEEVQIDYIWKRQVKGVYKHRAWVEQPDGTKKSIELGSFATYHTDSTSWEFGEPHSRKLRSTDIFVLDQRGDWIFSLEVVYADDTTSLDRRIVHVASKTARAQFDLSEVGINMTATGVDFDSENRLWILCSNGNRQEVKLHYDRMLIDYQKKIIYLRENYEKVVVI